MKIIVILFFSMLLALPTYGQNRETDYLSHVLEKMNAVESVTYHCVKRHGNRETKSRGTMCQEKFMSM